MTEPLGGLFEESQRLPGGGFTTLCELLKYQPPKNCPGEGRTPFARLDHLGQIAGCQHSVSPDGPAGPGGKAQEPASRQDKDLPRFPAPGCPHTDVLWLLAPTGTGKTEALLLWAGDADRLEYLFPIQPTANAMWRRICGDDRVGLAHGRASCVLHEESDDEPLDARLFGLVFAKPVIVSTLGQDILAHLHSRYWEERLTVARHTTPILDELHSYQPHTPGLVLQALSRESPRRLALGSPTWSI